MNDSPARFLAIAKALPRDFNRYVSPSMFTSDVSGPYELLKKSVFKRGNLTE